MKKLYMSLQAERQNTFEGLQYVLKELRDKDYSFVKLEDTNI